VVLAEEGDLSAMPGESRTLDVSHLPQIGVLQNAALFWGAVGISLIEGAMFALLAASYYYARMSVDVWPPPGTVTPPIGLPTLELALLLLSVPPAYWATKAAQENDVPKTRQHLFLNVALGLLAIVVRGVIWAGFNFNWKTDIHGSAVWMMMTLHTFETLVSLVIAFVIAWLTYTTRYGDPQRKAIDFDSVTWYFLVGIWIPLYLTIYVAPRVIGS
jgi:cytochrome c oxidase subunit I+III